MDAGKLAPSANIIVSIKFKVVLGRYIAAGMARTDEVLTQKDVVTGFKGQIIVAFERLIFGQNHIVVGRLQCLAGRLHNRIVMQGKVAAAGCNIVPQISSSIRRMNIDTTTIAGQFAVGFHMANSTTIIIGFEQQITCYCHIIPKSNMISGYNVQAEIACDSIKSGYITSTNIVVESNTFTSAPYTGVHRQITPI